MDKIILVIELFKSLQCDSFIKMGEVEEVQERKDVMLERDASVEDSEQLKPVVVHIPRVAARTITGPANLQNQGAIDW